ncbi:MAG: hypothetical protein QF576_03495 [Candidatus Poseidoniia archaeon]|nr:hypothetical protein [Candidatus Poseidoniia archaeon]
MVGATLHLQTKIGFAAGADFPFLLLVVTITLLLLGNGRLTVLNLLGI